MTTFRGGDGPLGTGSRFLTLEDLQAMVDLAEQWASTSATSASESASSAWDSDQSAQASATSASESAASAAAALASELAAASSENAAALSETAAAQAAADAASAETGASDSETAAALSALEADVAALEAASSAAQAGTARRVAKLADYLIGTNGAYVDTDDNIWMWGNGSDNQFGMGLINRSRYYPIKVRCGVEPGFDDPETGTVVAIYSYYNSVHVLYDTGNLYYAGNNTGYKSGWSGAGAESTDIDDWQRADVDNIDKFVYSRENGDNKEGTFFAHDSVADTWYGWGSNQKGQIVGSGTTVDQKAPVEITNPSPGYVIEEIWAQSGNPFCAVFCRTSDDKLWAAGSNVDGNLGLGNNTNQTTWQEVTGLSSETIVDVQMTGAYQTSNTYFYSATAFLTDGGDVYTAGYANGKALGTGEISGNRNTVQKVDLDGETVTDLYFQGAGNQAVCFAYTSAGNMWRWGYLPYGTAGKGVTVGNVATAEKVTEWSATDGKLWVYTTAGYPNRMGYFFMNAATDRLNHVGYGTYGAGGCNDSLSHTTPKEVVLTPAEHAMVKDIRTLSYSGSATSFLLLESGNIMTCGYGSQGVDMGGASSTAAGEIFTDKRF